MALRIASVLAMIHSILHTLGGVLGKPQPGAQETTMALMKAGQFPVMGITRSYADFYLGFGLFITVALAIEAVVFWQLATLVKAGVAGLRPILAAFTIAYLAYATIALLYFFAPPAIFEVLIAICLGISLMKAK